ncbi:unnamed protein product [Mycena citricolor]|uniref:Uncharacterized protein n=1 Tax=Mycena citricolor TaxID=2018698 RepID=A0AAD2H1I5_9AGAR|nr:unnamed protein product [Mycena citricolor]
MCRRGSRGSDLVLWLSAHAASLAEKDILRGGDIFDQGFDHPNATFFRHWIFGALCKSKRMGLETRFSTGGFDSDEEEQGWTMESVCKEVDVEQPMEIVAPLPYMVPRNVYCLPRLPLNTSDKTDHKLIKLRMEELIRDAKFPSRATTPVSTSSDEDDLSSRGFQPQLDLGRFDHAPSRRVGVASGTDQRLDRTTGAEIGAFWEEQLLRSRLLAQTLIEKVRGQLPSGSSLVSVLDLFTYPCLDDFIPFVQSRAPAKVTAPRVKGPRMSRQSSTKSLAPASQVDTPDEYLEVGLATGSGGQGCELL